MKVDSKTSKHTRCFPGDSVVKRQEMGDWIPGWGRSPGGGNGNPLQYSCLKNPSDRGTWRAAVPGVAESGPTEHTQAH